MSRYADWAQDLVEVLEVPTGDDVLTDLTTGPAVLPGNGSVVYEEDKVIAYFDDMERAVRPEFATWAKVWEVEDGRMKLTIVSFKEEPDA